MKCPKCRDKTRVLETRETATTIRRRRQCVSPLCEQRFTTTELNNRAPQVIDDATFRARALTQDLLSPKVDREALAAAVATDIRRAQIARDARAARRQERDTWYDTDFDPAPSVLDAESLKRELGEF